MITRVMLLAGAALGLLSPVWSALLHGGMTLGVLLHSMAGVRLKTRGSSLPAR